MLFRTALTAALTAALVLCSATSAAAARLEVLRAPRVNCATVRCQANPSCDATCARCKVTPPNPSEGRCCAVPSCSKCTDGFTLSKTTPATCVACPSVICPLFVPSCGANCTDCHADPVFIRDTTCRACSFKNTKCHACAEGFILRDGRCVAHPTRGTCEVPQCLVFLPCDANCSSCRTVTPRGEGRCPVGCPENVCRRCNPGFAQTGPNKCEAT